MLCQMCIGKDTGAEQLHVHARQSHTLLVVKEQYWHLPATTPQLQIALHLLKVDQAYEQSQILSQDTVLTV